MNLISTSWKMCILNVILLTGIILVLWGAVFFGLAYGGRVARCFFFGYFLFDLEVNCSNCVAVRPNFSRWFVHRLVTKNSDAT
jgi:hypothetical protein